MPQPALALCIEDVSCEVAGGRAPSEMIDFGVQPILPLHDETVFELAA